MRKGAGQTIEGAYLAKISSSMKKRRIPQYDHCKKPGHKEKDYWHSGKPQHFKRKRFGHLQKNCEFENEECANLVEVIEEETLF